MKLFNSICLVHLFLAVSVDVQAAEERSQLTLDGTRTWHITSANITGPNSFCGQPKWIMPPPFSPDDNFTLMGSYNDSPDASNSIRLSPEHCDPDLVLATHQNQLLNTFGGLPNADPGVQNIPLHQVPIKTTLDGLRTFLPPDSESNGNPFPPTRSRLPPITLGQWLSAKGKMQITCDTNGNSSVLAGFTNLIPNGVYTFVSIWITIPPGMSSPSFVPMPMGGVPGEFVADTKGSATFKRDLSYCPMDVTPDGSFIMFVDVAYHTDGSSKGVFPQTALQAERFRMPDGSIVESFIAPGILAIPQIAFAMRIEHREESQSHTDKQLADFLLH